jgi:ABC-type transport system involved in multi-copper enzyme maturation permease subunit
MSLGWLRRTLRWSNSRESWQERLGFGAILGAAFILLAVRGRLTFAQEVLLWGLLLTTLAVLLRRGWLRLFGPMLFYDLVRIGRRDRYFLMRVFYAIILAALLCWIYLIYDVQAERGRLDIRHMADFAATFFYSFVSVQFVVMVILTPAYTAGAIADEKDRKTLEFLLATDLDNREIVLSKFLSRVMNLGLLLLAGLPILGFTQVLGGVDPNLVTASYAVTLLTMVSLAALSILNSAYSKKPRDAIVVTYVGAVAYMVVSGISWLLLIPTMGIASWPSTATWTSPFTLEDAVYAFNAGNPVSGLVQIGHALDTRLNMEGVLASQVWGYAVFHGLVILFCCLWSVFRLRAIVLKESYGKAQRVPWRRRFLPRLAVGNHPMLWKELLAEPGLRLNMFGRVFISLLIIAGFVPVGLIIWDASSGTKNIFQFLTPLSRQVAEPMNIWVRVFGTLVACLLLVGVAVRAANCISSERDRQTLDGLLTTPLESGSILFSKWLGNVASVRWGWLWLGSIYYLSYLTSGLELAAVGLLLLAWFVYAATVSTMGMWFSIVSRTSLGATLWTLFTVAAAGVGHWIIWMCFIPVMITGEPSKAFTWIMRFEVGLTPPAVLAYSLPFCEVTEREVYDTEFVETLGAALFGLAVWLFGTGILWFKIHKRFGQMTGRTPWPHMSAPQLPDITTAVSQGVQQPA